MAESVPAPTSFVTDILATAGRLEKEDLQSKVGKLTRGIEDAKVEIYNYIQKKYDEFSLNLSSGHDLRNQLNTLSGDMKGLSHKIETEIKGQVNMSTTEFMELSSQLEEGQYLVLMLDKVVELTESFEAVDLSLKAMDYTEAANQITKMETLLPEQSYSAIRENEVHIFTVLQNKYHSYKEKLFTDLEDAWREKVTWTLPRESEQSKCTVAEVTIAVGEKNKAVLSNLVQAMASVDALDETLLHFSHRVLNYMLKPIILYFDSDVKICGNSGGTLQVIHGSKTPAEPVLVFKKIDKIFQFLNKHLLNIEYIEDKNESAQSVSLMVKLGSKIFVKFLDLIIKECLANAIPSSHKDLETFSAVKSATYQFEKLLTNYKFIDKENHALTDYVEKYKILFADKKSQKLLQQARELMVCEIHNTIEISHSTQQGEIEGLKISGKDEKSLVKTNVALNSKSKLVTGISCFPKCHISTSVQSLLQLAYESLHEATSSTPECAIQLFYTVRNMFEMYCDVVPKYHKDSLAKLPQLSAIHHNNCMYLAQHLMTLDHQFKPNLPKALSQGMASFMDLVPRLKRIGTQSFCEQMKLQKDLLLEYLSNVLLLQNTSEEGDSAHMSMKQCLHHLHHLNKVWMPVLPTNIYNKVMGTLVNTVVVEVVTGVVGMEDISADDASQLHSVLQLLVDDVPTLFSENDNGAVAKPALLHEHISKWAKFCELMVVLNASLHDINDRWADGKGPLASEFSANEVKQLIRALFQNTERRAAVLSNIH